MNTGIIPLQSLSNSDRVGGDLLSDEAISWFPRNRNDSNAYTLTADIPSWLVAVRRRLSSLQALPGNWDSHGAQRISAQAVILAEEILRNVVRTKTPEPSIVPSPDGHVQAEWHVGGIDLEVEFESPTEIHVLFQDLRNQERDWEETLSDDLSRLVGAVDEVTRRS